MMVGWWDGDDYVFKQCQLSSLIHSLLAWLFTRGGVFCGIFGVNIVH